MSVLFIVVPLALLVVFAAVLAFIWAASRGQFDDLTTPAIRALQDDGPIPARITNVENATKRAEGIAPAVLEDPTDVHIQGSRAPASPPTT